MRKSPCGPATAVRFLLVSRSTSATAASETGFLAASVICPPMEPRVDCAYSDAAASRMEIRDAFTWILGRCVDQLYILYPDVWIDARARGGFEWVSCARQHRQKASMLDAETRRHADAAILVRECVPSLATKLTLATTPRAGQLAANR